MVGRPQRYIGYIYGPIYMKNCKKFYEVENLV